MPQRLIWNFELSSSKQQLQLLNRIKKPDELKWEARFFWPDDFIIHLDNVDDSLLDLANYQQKYKKDYYYLLPENTYNIKRRRNKLLYKPLINESTKASGFGAKLSLDFLDKNAAPDLNRRLSKIAQRVQSVAIEVPVTKESFTYKFPTHPSTRLELARLEVKGKIYFSACIEGKSLYLVECISQHLLGNAVSCDYVTFLKKIIES